MNEELLIGVDIGTQGTKASVYRPDGNALAHAFEESRLIYGPEESVEQDPEEIYGSVLRTVRCAVERSGIKADAVAAIGIDGQMAGIMAVDKDWNPVTPYDSWLDTRCGPYIAVMKEMAEERIVRITGGQVTYAHGPKLLWWKKEWPEVYRRAAKFIQPSVYAAGKLCGLRAEDAFLDHTYLHFSGFADNMKREWSEELLETFGVEKEKLPRIVNPSDVIGHLTPEAARECGLTNRTIVAAGCGDSAASSLGCGITEPGMLYDVAGTASVFSAATGEYAPDVEEKTILYARSAIEDMWIPLAYLSGGGLCLRWFRDLMGLSYEELEKKAGEIPWGSDGLQFIPHFSGVTCPNMPGVKGGFLGLKWNHTVGHMYRSILESIVWEYANYYRILQKNVKSLQAKGIYGVGGGTGSRLFCQMKADVCGLPYMIMEGSEAATWGSAVIAGKAAGILPSLKSADVNRKISGVMPVNMETNGKFSSFVLKYIRLLENVNHMGE